MYIVEYLVVDRNALGMPRVNWYVFGIAGTRAEALELTERCKHEHPNRRTQTRWHIERADIDG